ncbi:MAG: NADH-quinone oxidoreductase subunit N [Phycisphaerales bacterium]|nr:NADH-quinone oxidoreductase subunit N [Phycisphaerales bacterium]
MTSLLASMWLPSGEDLIRFAPELALVGTLAVLLTVPLVIGRSSIVAGRIAMVGVVATLLLAITVGRRAIDGGLSGLAPPAAGGMLILDNLTVYFKAVLMLFLAGTIVLWFIISADTEQHGTEFFVLLLGSALGMVLMTATLNLLMIVVAIELASLPSYAIVGFDKHNRKAAEASLKYAIFGAVSAAIMLYGVSLIYGLYHTLNMTEIAPRLVTHLASGHNVFTIGIALVLVLGGIAFKIAAVPFHFWCPDAFEGARIEVTTWLSVSSKAAALLLLLRLVDALSGAAAAQGVVLNALTGLAWVIGLMAAVTCTWGNFAAYRQDNVKRLLAYSSIAHAGYMLMAAAVFAHPASVRADHSPIAAVLVYLLVYAVMNLGAFTVVAVVAKATGSESLSAFNGLGRRSPWLGVAMVMCLVSLVGLPPFGGFIAKLWLLLALGSQGGTLCWLLILVAVGNTLISLFFYFRIVRAMYLFDDRQPSFSAPVPGIALVNLCAVALLLLGVLFINRPKLIADRYARNLFAQRPAGFVQRPLDRNDGIDPGTAVVRADEASSTDGPSAKRR